MLLMLSYTSWNYGSYIRVTVSQSVVDAQHRQYVSGTEDSRCQLLPLYQHTSNRNANVHKALRRPRIVQSASSRDDYVDAAVAEVALASVGKGGCQYWMNCREEMECAHQYHGWQSWRTEGNYRLSEFHTFKMLTFGLPFSGLSISWPRFFFTFCRPFSGSPILSRPLFVQFGRSVLGLPTSGLPFSALPSVTG